MDIDTLLADVIDGQGAGYSMEDLIDSLYKVREVIKAEDKEINKKKVLKVALDEYVLTRLEEMGVMRTGTNVANVSISEEVVPTVNDWETLFEYIQEHSAFYLIQRRMNAGAYRELIATGEVLAGVESFTKRKLNMRKVS